MISQTPPTDQTNTPSIRKQLFVVKGARFRINQDIYHRNKLIYPTTYKMAIGHVGKSAVSFVHTLTDKSTNMVLVWNWRNVVAIDPASGKSTKLDTSYKEDISKYSTMDLPIKLARYTKPDKAYVYNMQMSSSDCDLLNHVNHASNIRFCMDAASDACKAGVIVGFPGDFDEYDVRQIDILHDRQVYEGDNLNIVVWENQEQELTLHFLLEREGSTVTSVTIYFYSYSSSARL